MRRRERSLQNGKAGDKVDVIPHGRTSDKLDHPRAAHKRTIGRVVAEADAGNHRAVCHLRGGDGHALLARGVGHRKPRGLCKQRRRAAASRRHRLIDRICAGGVDRQRKAAVRARPYLGAAGRSVV